nr:unnamed protein product [Digitaria exilis]
MRRPLCICSCAFTDAETGAAAVAAVDGEGSREAPGDTFAGGSYDKEAGRSDSGGGGRRRGRPGDDGGNGRSEDGDGKKCGASRTQKLDAMGQMGHSACSSLTLLRVHRAGSVGLIMDGGIESTAESHHCRRW